MVHDWLRLLHELLENDLMLAPSLSVQNALGVFTCSARKQGDQLLRGTSRWGDWVSASEVGTKCIQNADVVLVETYTRQPRATECRYVLGQRNCDIWPNLQRGGFANVETSHASDRMDNDYLVWRALSDLQPYTELV